MDEYLSIDFCSMFSPADRTNVAIIRIGSSIGSKAGERGGRAVRPQCSSLVRINCGEGGSGAGRGRASSVRLGVATSPPVRRSRSLAGPGAGLTGPGAGLTGEQGGVQVGLAGELGGVQAEIERLLQQRERLDRENRELRGYRVAFQQLQLENTELRTRLARLLLQSSSFQCLHTNIETIILRVFRYCLPNYHLPSDQMFNNSWMSMSVSVQTARVDEVCSSVRQTRLSSPAQHCCPLGLFLPQ